MGSVSVSSADIKRVKGEGFLHNKETDNFSGRILTRNGKITAAQQRCIGEAAEKFGNGEVTFTTRQTIEVVGIPYEKIEEFQAYIAKEGLKTGGTGAKVRPVVSCKGTTCRFGLLDSFALSEKIHERFFEGYHEVKLPHKFKIAVGGCPNNCVKPNLNDLGIVGQRVPVFKEEGCKGCKKCKIAGVCPVGAAAVKDGKLEIDPEKCIHCGRCVGNCLFDCITEGNYGYKIYIGGRWGKMTAHGKALEKLFTSEEEVLDIVEKAILLFREQGKTGERFCQTIDRIGFENVQRQLLSGELLDRKEEILQAQLHTVSGSTC